MAPPMLAAADGGADDGRLQAGERALQELVIAGAGLPADRGQELIGREAQEARGLEAEVFGLDDLARRPDQHVGVPDGRHAVLGHGVDLDADIAGFVEDRRRAPGFGEREERPLHQVALIARAGVAGGDDERFELAPFAGGDEAAAATSTERRFSDARGRRRGPRRIEDPTSSCTRPGRPRLRDRRSA